VASIGASRHRLAVVADDLTGAADAAAPFAARGLSVAVALVAGSLPDVEVVAVLTDNRWRSPSEATARMREAVGGIRSCGPDLLFVKIDSTLRGQVRADVEGALAAWHAVVVVATPAFPAQGRVVRDGALLVHGEPTVAQVAALFPAPVRVVDAESHDDLVAVSRRIVAERSVAVGSGGLSRALAAVLVEPPRPTTAPAGPVTGVLLVVGTPHPTTSAQVAQLAADAIALGSDTSVPDVVATAVAALRAGRRVVLTAVPDGAVEPESPAAAALAARLADAAVGVLAAEPGTGLVLTGGTTALAVATALGATELRLYGEVTAGLPLGELVAGSRVVPVVTKSGGFGAPDALSRAAEALEECA
jgi:D-threonate/D-erythronate kinase